jgi:hypothetical protein
LAWQCCCLSKDEIDFVGKLKKKFFWISPEVIGAIHVNDDLFKLYQDGVARFGWNKKVGNMNF